MSVAGLPPPPYHTSDGETWKTWMINVYLRISSQEMTLLGVHTIEDGEEYLVLENIFDDQKYDRYRVHFSNIKSNTNVLRLGVQLGTGQPPSVNWISGSTSYVCSYHGVQNGTHLYGELPYTGNFAMVATNSIGPGDDHQTHGVIKFSDTTNLDDSFLMKTNSWGKTTSNTLNAQHTVTGLADAPSASITSIRFLIGKHDGTHENSWTFKTGQMRIYGYKDKKDL